jgi:hypothetical protein
LSASQAANTPSFSSSQSDILTVEQAGHFLGMTKRQVWEMTRARGRARMAMPVPLLRVNGNIRFKRSSLETWVNNLEEYERTGRLPST